MKIDAVCLFEGEAALLHAAIADFSPDGARVRYAAWLDTQGDTDRANAVRATLKAYQNFDKNELNSLPGSPNWHDMIAVPLLLTFIAGMNGFERAEMFDFRDLVFGYLRPALSLSYAEAEIEPAIGSSFLWGRPDLPENEAWPKISEASDWFDAKDGLPPDQHCAFIGQFSFPDCSDTVLGQELPSGGGFSVFAIMEVESLGITETVVRSWSSQSTKTRRETPLDLIEDKLGDETNMPKSVHVMELKEVLSLPDACDGPFAAGIPNCCWGETYYDFYSALTDVCNGNTLGIGGYLAGTSGGDPSPNINSLRLAVLRVNPDCGIVHFAVPASDLSAGRFDKVEYVWNDFDG